MDTDATPVTLDVAEHVAPSVRGWLETIGWQVVDAGTAAVVPPSVALTDTGGSRTDLAVPAVLLVKDEDDPVATAARAGAVRPRAVVRWPDERDRLPAVVRDVLAVSEPSERAGALVVGGASGGVGTTTVALALGGLTAWRGRRTLVVGSGDVPCGSVGTIDHEALAAPGVWRAATPAPGVPGLRVVRARPAQGRPSLPHELDDAELVVADVGQTTDVDVLVLRRDAAGVAALERSGAGLAVVLDQGPVHPRDLIRTAAGRRLVNVPYSVRVARAGLARRVPAGLPGSWLRLLAPVVRGT